MTVHREQDKNADGVDRYQVKSYGTVWEVWPPQEPSEAEQQRK